MAFLQTLKKHLVRIIKKKAVKRKSEQMVYLRRLPANGGITSQTTWNVSSLLCCKSI